MKKEDKSRRKQTKVEKIRLGNSQYITCPGMHRVVQTGAIKYKPASFKVSCISVQIDQRCVMESVILLLWGGECEKSVPTKRFHIYGWLNLCITHVVNYNYILQFTFYLVMFSLD